MTCIDENQQYAVPTVTIFGVPVSKLGMQDTVQHVIHMVQSGKPHQVITANPIMIMAGLSDSRYMSMMKAADLVVPDGAGVVWAAQYVGNPVAERVPGIELMHQLLKTGEDYGWRVYILGASEDIIQASAERIRQQYPALKLVGARNGFFNEEQDEQVIADIQAAKPHLLFVGRSADKQEPWIGKYKEKLGVPLMMGIGGSFDVLAGKTKRAPRLFQKLRLEWFYRLLQEPWRYKRMLVLPKFAMKVIREKENVQKP